MRNILLAVVLGIFLAGCASSYRKQIGEVSRNFYTGNFDQATKAVGNRYQDSSDRDRLLWLMEAGLVFHSQGRYKKSIEILTEAERISDTIQQSVTGTAASFVLSDRNANFRGEDYERVLIKFYLALNYMMSKDMESAKRYFRKISYEQNVLKDSKGAFAQNLMARYMDALVSEQLGQYNDARVQYKNVAKMGPEDTFTQGDRYVLALRERDRRDIQRYRGGSKEILAFDTNMKPVRLAENNVKSLGELVVIHQAGRAAVKVSRGKIGGDPVFRASLEGAVRTVAQARGQVAAVAAMGLVIGTAEHPIPVYRNGRGGAPQMLYLNGKPLGATRVLFSYSDAALAEFNENYNNMVAKNVTSLATKFVAGYVAAAAAANSAAGNRAKAECTKRLPIPILNAVICELIFSAATGAAAGAGVAATIAPDLRSWTLVPDNFQIMRVFLTPGKYTLQFTGPDGRLTAPLPVETTAGGTFFVNVRTTY